MLYNIAMRFDEWITRKYLLFRGNAIGREGSISEFAKFLGIPQPILSGWMKKGGKIPKSHKYISALARIYGDEVFDILGIEKTDYGYITISHGGHIIRDDDLAPIAELIVQFPPEQRSAVRRAIVSTLAQLVKNPLNNQDELLRKLVKQILEELSVREG